MLIRSLSFLEQQFSPGLLLLLVLLRCHKSLILGFFLLLKSNYSVNLSFIPNSNNLQKKYGSN